MKNILFVVLLGLCVSSCTKVREDGVTYDVECARMAIEAAIADTIIPGAVLCVVEEGEIVYTEAYGNRAVSPEVEEMTENTIFDLASVSKPVGVGTAALLLIKEGRLSADDYVCAYIPNYHKDVQVRHLMTHYSGLPAYMGAVRLDSVFLANELCMSRSDFMIDTIATCRRPSDVDEKYRYSCLNFISLQRVIETIVGMDVNAYMRGGLYAQLGLTVMGWLPADSLTYRIAPTERVGGACLRGEVHDPLARVMMQGVSGNAGVFATAEDVANWAIWYMNLPQEVRVQGCNAGLWTDSVETSAGGLVERCRHTGYTGTSVTMLPTEKRAVVLLTNRVHPRDARSVGALRKEINALLVP